MSRAWTRFWFPPGTARGLAACRIGFFGGLLLLYGRWDASAWGSVSPVFWMPIPQVAAWGLGPPSTGLLRTAQLLWKLALLTAALGLLPRASAAVVAWVGLLLLGVPHNFGKVDHADAIVPFIALIFSVSRCGDAWVLDRRGSRVHDAAPEEYGWPIRLVQVLMSVVFFGAGLSKLRHSGLAWITSDNLATLLIAHPWHHRPAVRWGPLLAPYRMLCHGAAALTIACELGFPLALWSVRLRAVLVPTMLALLIGIRLFLGPNFPLFMLCSLFWVPWERWTRPG